MGSKCQGWRRGHQGGRDERQSGISKVVVVVVVVLVVLTGAAGVAMYLIEHRASLKSSVQSDVRSTTSLVETALVKADQDESKIVFTGGTGCVKTGDTRYCTFSSDSPGAINGLTVSVAKGNTIKVTLYLKLDVYKVAGENDSLKSGGQVAAWTFYSQSGSSKWTPSEP